jgi:SAM-dependent methyltransferase
MTGSPDPDIQQLVVHANREFYARLSEDYFVSRDVNFAEWYVPRFERNLASYLPYLPVGRPPKVLDACAGTGVATRLLLDKGWPVTAVDLSPHMLSQLRKHVLKPEDPVTVVEAEITEFLRSSDESFDLIVFAAAIHHLFNYEEVIELALGRLERPGAIYLVGEPVQQPRRLGRAVRRSEFVLKKLSRQPRDILPALWRRVKYWRAAREVKSDGTTVGLAEDQSVNGFYAEVFSAGLDFDLIRSVLARNEAEIVAYDPQISTATLLRYVKPRIPGYTTDSCNLVAVRGARHS